MSHHRGRPPTEHLDALLVCMGLHVLLVILLGPFHGTMLFTIIFAITEGLAPL